MGILLRFFGAAFLCLALSCLSGCANDESTPGSPAPYEITKVYKEGKILLALCVSRKEITTADRIRLFLEVRADEDMKVEFPGFKEQPEGFSLVDEFEDLPQLLDNRRVLLRKHYELEPFLPGEYIIPAWKISVFNRENISDKRLIETAKIKIIVKSVLVKGQKNVLREISGPGELPHEGRVLLYCMIGLGIIVLLSAAGGFILYRLRRRNEFAEPVLAPHEIAMLAIENLLSEDLLEKGELKLFHSRLSDILRRYIEQRFGLRAPERTTEEFLEELRSNSVLEKRFRRMLRQFLTQCDMVKFARYDSSVEEVKTVLDICRSFIDATAHDEDVDEAEVTAGEGVVAQ